MVTKRVQIVVAALALLAAIEISLGLSFLIGYYVLVVFVPPLMLLGVAIARISNPPIVYGLLFLNLVVAGYGLATIHDVWGWPR